MWWRKRRLKKDQNTLTRQHSISFLNFRAIQEFLPSSSLINDRNTRQLRSAPPPPVISLYVKTIAHKHFFLFHPSFAAWSREWSGIRETILRSDSTKAQRYSHSGQLFVSLSGRSEACCISFNYWVF